MPRRHDLDGLRGLAALQVVLLHYVSAFWPRFESPYSDPTCHGWHWCKLTQTPLYLVYDGLSAVIVFFILSGYVLTLAFANADQSTLLRLPAARVLRLSLPVLASLAFASLLINACPDANTRAAELTGSHWFREHYDFQSKSAPRIESPLGPLFLGYRETSLPALIWPSFTNQIDSVHQSTNFPLWTIHLELYGSLLVFLLIGARRWPFARALRLGLLVGFAGHGLGLFVLGHMIALRDRARRDQAGLPFRNLYLYVAFGLGYLIWQFSPFHLTKTIQSALRRLPFSQNFFWRQTLVGIMTFLFVWQVTNRAPTGRLRRWLESAPLRFFGRISFALYLVHVPILFTVVSQLLVKFGLTVATISGLAITFAAAGLFSRGIDQPAIWLSRRVLGRH